MSPINPTRVIDAAALIPPMISIMEVRPPNCFVCTIFHYPSLDDVEVNYYGCGSWYPAKISDILEDPVRYVVAYEDGSIVEETDATHIRKLAGIDKKVNLEGGSIFAVAKDFDSRLPVDTDEVKIAAPYFVNSDLTASILSRSELLGGLGMLMLGRESVDPHNKLLEENSAIFSEISDILNDASTLAMDEGKAKLAMKYLDHANFAASKV